MDIKIRKVKKEDLPAVVDIRIKGWQFAYRGIIDDGYLDNLSSEYSKRIKKMEKTYMTNGFIVAESNNEVVGFCRYAFDNNASPEIENFLSSPKIQWPNWHPASRPSIQPNASELF